MEKCKEGWRVAQNPPTDAQEQARPSAPIDAGGKSHPQAWLTGWVGATTNSAWNSLLIDGPLRQSTKACFRNRWFPNEHRRLTIL